MDLICIYSNFLMFPLLAVNATTIGPLSPIGRYCANFNTRKRTNRLQYSVCASARSYLQGNCQILVSYLINLILT
jgi:hypothetical protein